MNCKDCVEFLDEFETLNPDDARALREHLAACPDCSAYAEWSQELGSSIRASTKRDLKAPVGVAERALQTLAESGDLKSAQKPNSSLFNARFMGVAAMLIICGILIVTLGPGTDDPNRTVATAERSSKASWDSAGQVESPEGQPLEEKAIDVDVRQEHAPAAVAPQAPPPMQYPPAPASPTHQSDADSGVPAPQQSRSLANENLDAGRYEFAESVEEIGDVQRASSVPSRRSRLAAVPDPVEAAVTSRVGEPVATGALASRTELYARTSETRSKSARSLAGTKTTTAPATLILQYNAMLASFQAREYRRAIELSDALLSATSHGSLLNSELRTSVVQQRIEMEKAIQEAQGASNTLP